MSKCPSCTSKSQPTEEWEKEFIDVVCDSFDAKTGDYDYEKQIKFIRSLLTSQKEAYETRMKKVREKLAADCCVEYDCWHKKAQKIIDEIL